MSGAVRFETAGDVGIIVIDNPPVNASSAAVRAGLLEAVRRLDSDPTLRAAVLIGANRSFVAGSDIREFSKPLAEPQLPAVIAAIEASPKPVVAALQGAALGGGYELALGCDARVMAPGTVVGLLEVTLGMIPGAGGTQRLTRLTGIATAIGLICAGRRVPAEQAVALKLADAMIEGDLLQGALAYARALPGKNLLREKPVPPDAAEPIAAAEKAALKAGRNRPPVIAAIAAIKSSVTLSVAEALRRERDVFQGLRTGPEAAALRHLFFAEREAGKLPELRDVAPQRVAEVAVIGAGTMGAGIAACFADAGIEVLLVDRDLPTAEIGRARVAEIYARQVQNGQLSEADRTARLDLIRAAGEYRGLGDVDLAVEAVFENMQVKQEVFRALDAVLKPGALLASNTSYLDLDALAACTARPQNVLGLHFFSPANVMRLMEVVRAGPTGKPALATGFALAKRLRKLAVLAGNGFGFIGNRIYAAWRRQCEFMLEEGALPRQIDDAMEAFGFARGPFAVADMSGLDIAWRMRQSQAATRDPAARYVEIPDLLCERGRLGQKTGAGYYRYPPGARRGEVDEEVISLIEAASEAKGIVRREFTTAEIQQRVLISMVNEAAILLADGVAARPGDVDLVLVHGYGFPNWEGGPLFWAGRQAPDRLLAAQDELARLTGPGFRRGDIQAVLPTKG